MDIYCGAEKISLHDESGAYRTHPLLRWSSKDGQSQLYPRRSNQLEVRSSPRSRGRLAYMVYVRDASFDKSAIIIE